MLQASGRLNPYSTIIKHYTRNAIKQTLSLLPLSNVDIVIADNPSAVMPEIGIGGYTPNANLIFISLDPTFANLKQSIQDNIFTVITHELHHAARWRSTGYGVTLFEAMISEGLADHFATALSNKRPVWIPNLKPKLLSLWQRKARRYFFRNDYNHHDWFFGSEQKQMPKWIGYGLGYAAVAQYLKKHTGTNTTKLYEENAEVFI